MASPAGQGVRGVRSGIRAERRPIDLRDQVRNGAALPHGEREPGMEKAAAGNGGGGAFGGGGGDGAGRAAFAGRAVSGEPPTMADDGVGPVLQEMRGKILEDNGGRRGVLRAVRTGAVPGRLRGGS